MLLPWRVVASGSVHSFVEILDQRICNYHGTAGWIQDPKRELAGRITLNSKSSRSLVKVKMKKKLQKVILAFRSASRILKELFLLLYMYHIIYIST